MHYVLHQHYKVLITIDLPKIYQSCVMNEKNLAAHGSYVLPEPI
ncbi:MULTISPECIES: hypothetical protein [unclassified Moorena]|nr:MULTISPECIES: hypothetical protein [unclassified Moorena]